MTVNETLDLFDYDRWANRRLWDAVAALPPGEADREIGREWSVPTLKGMLAHILGAHIVWLARWRGSSPSALASAKDFPDLSSLRTRWDQAEADLSAFIAGLGDAELTRIVEYRNTEGQAFQHPLGPLMRHLVNHGTHHRSEVATMLTRLGVAPPPTDYVVYLRARQT